MLVPEKASDRASKRFGSVSTGLWGALTLTVLALSGPNFERMPAYRPMNISGPMLKPEPVVPPDPEEIESTTDELTSEERTIERQKFNMDMAVSTQSRATVSRNMRADQGGGDTGQSRVIDSDFIASTSSQVGGSRSLRGNTSRSASISSRNGGGSRAGGIGLTGGTLGTGGGIGGGTGSNSGLGSDLGGRPGPDDADSGTQLELRMMELSPEAYQASLDDGAICSFAASNPRELDPGIHRYMMRGNDASRLVTSREPFRIAGEDMPFEVQLACDQSSGAVHVMIVHGDELHYMVDGSQSGPPDRFAKGKVAMKRNGTIGSVSMEETRTGETSARRTMQIFLMWWNHISEL